MPSPSLAFTSYPSTDSNSHRLLSPTAELPHAYTVDLEYPPSECSPSLLQTPLPQSDRVAAVTRPELRVITEPGCYIIPLHPPSSAPVTSPVSEHSPDTTYSSPTSMATGSPPSSTFSSPLPLEPLYAASAAPAQSLYIPQMGASTVVHQPLTLPKLLPNPFFRFPEFPDASASTSHPQAVSIPPATDLEVEIYCPRKAMAFPAPSTRSRARSTPKPLSPTSSLEDLSSPDSSTLSLIGRAVTHPYARIFAKRDSSQSKRRRMWNHALEKSLFTPDELANMKAPIRRKIYMASLEAHIDALHTQLLHLSLSPVPPEALEPYYGLNCKTAKSMVSGLFKDATDDRLKLLELRRANDALRKRLSTSAEKPSAAQRRHSVGGVKYLYPNLFDGQNTTIVS